MYRFIMSQRYANLLFMLRKPKNLREISREIDMTISHLSNVTDQWEKEGIIKKNRIGREVDIEITKFGEKVIDIVQQFENLAKNKEVKK